MPIDKKRFLCLNISMTAKKNNVIILIITFFLFITLLPKAVLALAAPITQVHQCYTFRSSSSCDSSRSTVEQEGDVILLRKENDVYSSSGVCWTREIGFREYIYSITPSGVYFTPNGTQVRLFVSFEDEIQEHSLKYWNVKYKPEGLYKKLRLKIFLMTNNPEISSSVEEICLSLELQDRSEKGLKKRDDTRVSELKKTKRVLSNYYNDFSNYPVVNTNVSDKNRQWALFENILESASLSRRENYTRGLVDQPQGVDDEYKYGYLANNSGAYYLLWTKLEDINSKHFQDSWQGQVLGVDCVPPNYCIYSKSDYVAEPLLQYFEKDKRTNKIKQAEFIKTENSPQVWLKLNNYRFWLRTPGIFTQAGGDWDDISLASSLGDIPLLKFFKKQDEPEVYLITASGFKRHMPNSQILHYYGQAEEILSFEDTKIIDLLPENYLIRGKGQTKVYFLDQKIKRWVTSPQVLKKLGFDWSDVVVVEPEEIGYYAEGTPIF